MSSVASSAVSSTGGNCAGVNAYTAGQTYTTGAVVKHNNTKYTCTEGGWCTIGGPYEPGVGWAWTYAWVSNGSCQ